MVEGDGGCALVAENLFSTGREPQLLASKCSQCGSVFFPRRSLCRNPNCSRVPLEDIALGGRGTLYSFTVHHYMGALPFRLDPSLLPYAVALVEFPEGVRVMGMLAEDVDPEALQIGVPMEVTVGRLYSREDGKEIVTWKFRPVEARPSGR